MIFSTFDAYEQFLYALPDRFVSIQASTLALIRHGKSVAVVRGEVHANCIAVYVSKD